MTCVYCACYGASAILILWLQRFDNKTGFVIIGICMSWRFLDWDVYIEIGTFVKQMSNILTFENMLKRCQTWNISRIYIPCCITSQPYKWAPTVDIKSSCLVYILRIRNTLALFACGFLYNCGLCCRNPVTVIQVGGLARYIRNLCLPQDKYWWLKFNYLCSSKIAHEYNYYAWRHIHARMYIYIRLTLYICVCVLELVS